MQKEILPGLLAVDEIPKDQNYFDLYGSENSIRIVWTEMPKPGKFKQKTIKLPPGSWHLLGRPGEISEDVAAGIVESSKYPVGWSADPDEVLLPSLTLYMNYMIPKPVPVCYLYANPNESLLSLLRVHNFEPETTILLKSNK